MRKVLLALLPFLMLCACGEKKSTPEEDARNYGKYFVEKLKTNQLDSLKASYPAIMEAESIVPFESDTIIVTETSPGQFDLTLAEGVMLKVNRSEDGNFTVTESKGLFSFPSDKVELAKKTGMWDENLSDAQLNERMKDEEFFNHMNKKTRVSTKNILSVSQPHYSENFDSWTGYVEGYQIITNNSDFDISGKDYSIIKHVNKEPNSHSMDSYSKNITEPGKDIPAHGSVKIEIAMSFTTGAEVKGVKWNVSAEELSNRLVKFTGTEYQDYLNSKK